MSPLDASAMDDETIRLSPDAQGDAARALDGLRREYAAETETIGSIPIPGTVRGMAKLTSKRPELLLDKLGERLPFDRGRARLYVALSAKMRSG